MRQITAEQNATALRALAVYAEYSKPYVQRNGWTVIPDSAPRPLFEGVELTTRRVNDFTTDAELFRLATEKPDCFSAYLCDSGAVTTWTGESLGTVTERGHWSTNNFGGRSRAVRMRAAWSAVYYGREYDSCQLANFRRVKSA